MFLPDILLIGNFFLKHAYISLDFYTDLIFNGWFGIISGHCNFNLYSIFSAMKTIDDIYYVKHRMQIIIK